MGLKVRLLVKNLPIDEETYKELGKAVYHLARLGAERIVYADAEGIVLEFPDRAPLDWLTVTPEQIKETVGQLKKLVLDIDYENN